MRPTTPARGGDPAAQPPPYRKGATVFGLVKLLLYAATALVIVLAPLILGFLLLSMHSVTFLGTAITATDTNAYNVMLGIWTISLLASCFAGAMLVIEGVRAIL